MEAQAPNLGRTTSWAFCWLAGREEAAEHLLHATREVPEADLELAQLFRTGGDERRATLELDRYSLAIAPTPGK